MSILFDSHEDHTDLHAKKVRARSQQDERYPIQSSSDKYDDILIFGYQCKLFRDDQVADDVNNGKFLIPWMGNKDLMIDRYDCRGHLYRLEEFDFEKMGEFRPLSPERLDVENVCDEERYMDLKYDMSEEAILKEEEEKRAGGSALYDPFTAYQNIEYSYEDSSEGKTLSDCNASSNSNLDNDTYVQFCQYYGYNPDDPNLRAYFQSQGFYQYDYDRPPPPSEPPPVDSQDSTKGSTDTLAAPSYEIFEPPEGIVIPDGMEVPETKKMQAIIEKTAMFISKQSAQMEIVLKTKQSGNPQFAFLDFDNYLNPYYKFILGKIKDGEYEYTDVKANEIAKEEEESSEKRHEESEDESDDGNENELHPLLQAHRRPVNTTAPSPPKSPETNNDEQPIINPVPQTKLTGKVEDLAKVYMTWKYAPNPGESQQDETKENTMANDEEHSLEGVEELPPPPLPPPPSFVLSDSMNAEKDQNLSPKVPDDSHSPQNVDQNIASLQPQAENNQEEYPENVHEVTPHLIHGGQIFGPPIIPPPPSRPMFPQMRFQPTPVAQSHYPLQLGHRAFQPVPGHFIGGPFQHMPHQIQYSHPPELYQVRSSVPPPPPPPLPSLMPPGVDGPPISSINTIVTTKEGVSVPIQNSNSESNHVIVTQSHSLPIVSTSSLQSTSAYDPLLPPGEETNTASEKPGVPPPPPPPLPPSIDRLNNDDSTELLLDSICESDRKGDDTSSKGNLDDNFNETKKNRKGKHKHRKDEELHRSSSDDDNISHRKKTTKHSSHSSSPYTGSEKQKSYHRESKRRKRSSKNRNIDGKVADDILYSPDTPVSDNQHEMIPNNDSQSIQKYPQLTSQCSSQSVSPFEQINQTLKSIQGQSTSDMPPQTSADANVTPLPTKIVTPGKDLQLVIDRLALYVAKNGDEFEIGIKEKKDPRFDFLNPWNIYHPYYSNKKMANLDLVIKEKEEEEERRKNLKVKFGLKAKVKPVNVAQNKAATAAASVFNQNEEEEESSEAVAEGFQPNKDPELEVKRRLQKQIEEKEKLLKQLHEQALLQQKIAEVNRQASIKPMLQNLTPQQQAILKKKVQEKQQSKKDNVSNVKQDERKKRAASFVGMLKKNAETEESSDLAGNFLRKRQFKETSGSKGSNSEPPDKANYEKKKDAFFKAINDAFKGT